MLKEEKRKDYAFWRQVNEKLSVVLGCPGLLLTFLKCMQMCCLKVVCCSCAWCKMSCRQDLVTVGCSHHSSFEPG